MYDLVIIGGGPAALTAAIYAARKVLKTLVLAKEQGGQLLLTREIENWPGTIKIGGFELAEHFRKHVEHYGVEQRTDSEVVEIRRKDGDFEVIMADGEAVPAKAVLIATGGRSRPLGVPGEKEFTGRGVSYCATCDAPLFKGKRVAMIGGGNAAFEGVIDLLPIATEIHIVDIADHWFADPILQGQVLGADKVKTYQEHKVVEIRGD
ncbi:MAG: NAD(P)/FAD-dependent oxidoreductase, partial [Candidatus Bipolaricaulia bacterium]